MPRTPTAAIDTRTIKIDCNTALDFGTYTFTFKGDKKVPARFTFVYQYQDGQWLIEHHHSSMMPEKIIEAKNVHSKILKHHHQKYNTTTVPAKEKSIVNFHDH